MVAKVMRKRVGKKKISEKSKLRRKKFLNGSNYYFIVKFHFSKSFCTS